MDNNDNKQEENSLTKTIVLMKQKKFISVTNKGNPIYITINNCVMPFGVEKYKEKYILNLELEIQKNNELYNIYTEILNLENYIGNINNIKTTIDIKEILKNKIFVPTLKQSLNGYILRTQFKSPEIYILKKTGDKLFLSHENLKNTSGIISIVLKGIWYTNEFYGLLWMTKEINLKKL